MEKKREAAADGHETGVAPESARGNLSVDDGAPLSGEREKITRPASDVSSRQIIVLGMHRSGTSALTGVLSAMGIYVGEENELTGKSWENPIGFFERRDARKICDALLHESGADWWKVSGFDADNASPSAVKEQRANILGLVRQLDRRGTWALKEPRLCLLLPIFQSALINPLVIISLRHPVAVARSLRHRNGFPIQAGLALWEKYVVSAIRNSWHLKPIFVNYDDLINSKEEALSQLAGELRARGVGDLDVGAAETVVQPSLRREQVDEDDAVRLLSREQLALWKMLSGNPSFESMPSLSEQAVTVLKEFESSEMERRKFQDSLQRLNDDLKKARETERELRIAHMSALSEIAASLAQKDEAQKAALSLKREVETLRQLKYEQHSLALEKSKLLIEEKAHRAEISRLHEKVRALEASRVEADAIDADRSRLKADLERLRASEIEMKILLADWSRALAAANNEKKIERQHRSEVSKEVEDANFERTKLPKIERNLREELKRYQTLGTELGLSLSDIEGKFADIKAVVTSERERLDATATTAALRLNQGNPFRLGEVWLRVLGRIERTRWVKNIRFARERRILAGSPLFDVAWYLERNPDVAQSGMNAISHYLQFGAAEGRNPHPQFDTKLYLQQNPSVAERGKNPLVHFLNIGRGERGVLTQEGQKTKFTTGKSDDIALIKASHLFDGKWYLSEYEDVAKAKIDPAAHYLRYGARERRDPGPSFSTSWYLEKYPDVQRAGLNPLVHYLRHGKREQRVPAPLRRGSAWWEGLVSDRTERTLGKNILSQDALSRMQANSVLPAVVVPVYNAPREVDECLESLLRHTLGAARIIVIDDASTAPEVREVLAQYSGRGVIEVFQNDENLGFTRTMNKGIELAGRADVVFLNSDTKVTPGWLSNLRIAAYSEERIGTATPLSNNAGAFSAPEIGRNNEIPQWMKLDEYARAISQASARIFPRTPTGNGFCMYVRRDCLDAVGLLDAEAFPRGYGEENDFCMRAGRRGWVHVVDDATLIYHVRSASFGDAKTTLMNQGRRVVDGRYPDYRASVKEFIDGEPLRLARQRVGDVEKALAASRKSALPRVLFVLSTRTGGTPQTNQDLMHALGDRVEAFVLRCNSSVLTLSSFRDGVYEELEKHALDSQLTAFPHRSINYDAVVADWIVRYAIELVHIRHIAWHGLGLIDVAKTLGRPVIFSFHDFYTICPTVKLLDETNTYCGGVCTATNGQCRHELWPVEGFPPLKGAAIGEWRANMEKALKRCDVFITTTESARRVLADNYAFLNDRPFHVIPHGRDFTHLEDLSPQIQSGEKIRIVVPGNISVAKGGRVIGELGRLAAEEQLEIHILGTVSRDFDLPEGVVLHGAYTRDKFSEKIRSIRPHVGGIFSIWPETYCHTLTELWACGIPVIAFDFGAVGERIRESNAGWLASAPTAAGVIDVIQRILADPAEHETALTNVYRWQGSMARRDTCLSMSHAYYDLYRALLLRSPEINRPRVAIISRAKVEDGFMTAPASTHVRLLERTRDSLSRKVRYDLVSSPPSLEAAVASYDAVIVQRDALSQDDVQGLQALAERSSFKIFAEIDDDLLSEQLDIESSIAETEQVAVRKLLEAANMVFVSTDELQDRFSPLASNVVVEPNAIAARLWLPPLQSSDDILDSSHQRKFGSEVRVVYFGTPTHFRDLQILQDAVGYVRTQIPHFRLFTVGITRAHQDWFEPIVVPDSCKNYTDFVPWVRGVMETMDFAVAPLADTSFNKAKSDLKFIECAAAGIACLASNVGPYRKSIKHRQTGLLVENTTEAWSEALLFAAKNPRECQEISARARAEILASRLMSASEDTYDDHVLRALTGTK